MIKLKMMNDFKTVLLVFVRRISDFQRSAEV
jgi:hypothetical protein